MLFRASLLALSALLFAGSCANSGPPAVTSAQVAAPNAPAAAAPNTSTLEVEGPHKPSAPLGLTINAERTAPNATTYRVLLTASPTAEVTELALAIDGRDLVIGTLAKGVVTTHSATVELGGKPSRDIIGTARMLVDGRRMNKAVAIQIGVAAAPKAPTPTITLPDGTVVNEAR